MNKFISVDWIEEASSPDHGLIGWVVRGEFIGIPRQNNFGVWANQRLRGLRFMEQRRFTPHLGETIDYRRLDSIEPGSVLESVLRPYLLPHPLHTVKTLNV